MAAHIKIRSDRDANLKVRFGDNVRSFRRELGLSQQQLAGRARMHRTYLADIERGGRNISLFSIVRLVGAMGITLTRFFRKLDNGIEPPPIQHRERRSPASVSAANGRAPRRVRRRP